MYNAIASATMNAIRSNFAILAFPPVKPMDCIAARIVLETLTMGVIWAIFYATLTMVSDTRVVVDYKALCAAFFATTLLGAGIGTFNAVISTIYPVYDRFWGMMRLPIFFSSGIFYAPSQLPARAGALMEWNPIAHCIEWVRLATQFGYHPMLDRGYVIAFGTIFLCLGMFLERMFRYRLLSST